VRSLTVLCTSALLGPRENWVDRAHRARTEGTASLAPTVVARWFTPGFAAAQPDVVARNEAMLAGIDDEGYACCCEVIADMDLRSELPRITAPTLVVSRAEALAAPPEHQRAIAEAVPGARLTTLSPAAHLANIERPLEVTGAVLGHLDAASGDAGKESA
jgi:3-oxoadipate enol-lactonase